MSDNENTIIITLSFVIAGILFLSSILLRNLYFGIGGAGMLLASFVLISSIPSCKE